jgi:hypothetical protein
VAESGWFGRVSLDAAPDSARRVFDELSRMLDVVQPEALDRARSHAVDSGHDWNAYDVEFRLAHGDDERSDITVAVGKEEALVSWLMAHEHIYPDDGGEGRPWTTVVVDAVAALLRGEYEVRDHDRGDRLVKTSVHDRPLGGRHVSTSGSLLGLLPLLRRIDRVERRTIDFRCRE